MKDPITTPGKTYAVTSPNGCTVTTEDGLTLAEVEAGKQGYFVAVSGKVQLSDDSAILTQLFKLAPQQRLAILGVLGGNDGMPAGYTRLAYLEFTGTQFVDTGLAGYCADMYGEWRGVDNARNSRIFQSTALAVSPNIPYTRTFTVLATTPDMVKRGYVKGMRFGEVTTYYRLDESGLYVDDEKYSIDELPIESFPVSEYTLKLGAYHDGKKYPETWFIGQVSSFKAKLANGEVNMVPCLDETGAPCMFDLVSRKPFYNAGTGDFLYPTESTTYAMRRLLPDWGKLTENGLRRLYHAPAGYQGELYDYALENDYKPIIEPEKPEEGYWAPRWTETEDEIVLEWVETEPPMDEFGLREDDLTNN